MKKCLHCSTMVHIEDEQQNNIPAFCCLGCKSAYHLIKSLDLEAHYKFCREIFNTTPDKINSLTNEINYMEFVEQKGSDENSIKLMIEGIKCGSCVWLIESTLQKQEGVLQASINMTTKTMSLVWLGEKTRLNDLISLIEKLGYKALPLVDEVVTVEHTNQQKSLLKAIAVAGFVWVQNMMISMGIWAGTDEIGINSRFLMNICAAVVTIPGILYSGKIFFKSAWHALHMRKSHMDIPISIAIILTLLISIYGTFINSIFVYYEAASSLVFALLVGRYLDFKIRNKASEYARNLVLQKSHFITLCKDTEMHIVSIKDVKVGDIIHVATGERIPLDGLIAEGMSKIDNSIITGEAASKKVEVGERVFAGAINLEHPFKLKVETTVETTVLSEIQKLVEKSEQNRSKYKTIADKTAQVYTPVVLALTTFTFLIWLLVGSSFNEALLYGVSVLVITCPCAMGLAVPIVQVIAISNLMKNGIFVKSDTALERLSEVNAVALDKTGILTHGKPQLLNSNAIPAWTKSLMKSIASHSKHHICNSIVDNFKRESSVKLENVKEIKGIGVSGIWEYDNSSDVLSEANDTIYNNTKCRKLSVSIGRHNYNYIHQEKNQSSDEHILSTWFVIKNTNAEIIMQLEMHFADKIREETQDVIPKLSNTFIISGDKKKNVENVANMCGIGEWYGELTPQEKYEIILQKQSMGLKVLMIGDGLNDAAAMKAAHVSISPSNVMELSQNQADVVFQHTLFDILYSKKIARKAVRTSKQNIFISIIYNLISVPVAMLGFASPLVAAVFMSISSLFVVINTFLQMHVKRGR